MQTCYNCGKEVDDGVLICPECGALVKRYTTPPVREAEPAPPEACDAPDNPWYHAPSSGARDAAQPQNATGSVWRDERGGVHFRSGLTVWLVVNLLCSGYMALSYGCSLLVHRFQDFYFGILEQLPEFSEMLPVLRELVRYVGLNQTLFVIFLVLTLGAFVASIWLLAGRSRAALYTLLGFSAVLGAAMLAVNTLYALLTLGSAAVTFFWLKKYRSLLK